MINESSVMFHSLDPSMFNDVIPWMAPVSSEPAFNVAKMSALPAGKSLWLAMMSPLRMEWVAIRLDAPGMPATSEIAIATPELDITVLLSRKMLAKPP